MPASRASHFASVLLLSFMAPLIIGAQGPRSNFVERVLSAHNREREAVGLKPMKWSPELANSANSWANHLARISRLEHSPEPWGAEPEGENLWAGTAGFYQPEAMVGLWIDEKRDFKPGIFPDNSRSGDAEKVGHYTQVVWGQSLEVGCALQRGLVEDFLVCRYKVAGNVLGQSPLAMPAAGSGPRALSR